jgi:hypothetical protein
MGAHITSANTTLAAALTSLNAVNNGLQTILNLLNNIDSYNLQYSIPLYGLVLALGALTLIGVILVKCLNAICCRHFLYLVCIFCFLVGLLLFILTIVLAGGMVTSYYSCAYLAGGTFTSPTAFTNTITNLAGSQYSNLPASFSQCFGGTNTFMTALDPTLSNYLNQLQTAVSNSYLYNLTDLTYNVNYQLITISTLIDYVGLGHVPDFDPTTTNGQAEIT